MVTVKRNRSCAWPGFRSRLGENAKPEVSWKGRSLGFLAVPWEGLGRAGLFGPHCGSSLRDQGKTNVTAHGRPCGVLVLGAAAGEDTGGGVGG